MALKNKRIPVFDFLRGLAVFGFMLWHAFDMFYAGNKYDVPLFRATILTRISFVMVTGLVLGLKDWSAYRITDHLRRSLTLMSFTLVVAICYAIVKSSILPFYTPFQYLVGGTSDFTFSILISLGCIYLLVPLILKYSPAMLLSIVLMVSVVAAGMIFKQQIPEFFRFMMIALLFSYIVTSNLHDNVYPKAMYLAGTALFFLIIVFVIFDKDLYWYVRNSFLYQVAILLLFYVASSSIYFFKSVRHCFITKVVEVFGKNSLFVYIVHYVLYLTVSFIFSFTTSSCMYILLLCVVAVCIFYYIFQQKYIYGKLSILFR